MQCRQTGVAGLALALAIGVVADAMRAFELRFFVAILLLSPTGESGKIDIQSEYVISVTWADGTSDDIGTWIENPVGNLTWFRNRSTGLVHLDSDDHGRLNDSMEIGAKAIVNPLNQEDVSFAAGCLASASSP